MTSYSQNRHATNCVIFRFEESRIRTYDGCNPTDLQSATFNHSAISSKKSKNDNIIKQFFYFFVDIVKIAVSIISDHEGNQKYYW